MAFAVLILGAVLISTSGIFVKISPLGPDGTGFYRMFLSLPALGLWMLWRGRHAPYPVVRRVDWIALACAGIFLAADLIVWHRALHLIPVGAATLLGNTAPFWVALSGYLFFGERFGLRFLFGMGLAFGGACLLVLGSGQPLGGGGWIGYALGLAAGIGYAGYIRGVGWARGRLKNSQVMVYSALFAALTMLAPMLVTETQYWPVNIHGWSVLVGLAYISQIMGQGLIAWAMGALPPSFTAVSLLLNPVAAACFAWLALGETVTVAQMIGGAAVLAGIVIARGQGQKRGKNAPPKKGENCCHAGTGHD
ncbi:MAG TPA: DMT family transporter [Dongiaceae bacterium]|jgi:drug/metabolite transporter (DMT)-like permease|nr:DMT family transporter [Dongiaceae bacterium]